MTWNVIRSQFDIERVLVLMLGIMILIITSAAGFVRPSIEFFPVFQITNEYAFLMQITGFGPGITLVIIAMTAPKLQ